MIYKKIVVPSNHRLFFIGDIHGRFDMLMKAIQHLNITSEDTIVSVGDLIDRGPYSRECLDFFLEHDNCHFVIGNHEDLMINRDIYMETWLANGGEQTQEQLGADVQYYCDRILEKAPIILEVEHNDKTFGVVHAGIPLSVKDMFWNDIIKQATLDEDFLESLIWDRECIGAVLDSRRVFVNDVYGIDYVIHGHTPIPQPILEKNRIWIDTLYAADALTLVFMENGSWQFATVR